jgi:predicted Rossmann fold flavoprotein
VLNALLGRLERSGAELALAEAVVNMNCMTSLPVRHEDRERNDEMAATQKGAFRVDTVRRSLRCEKLVVTTGGKSYPGCGTTGDGYSWLAAMGHTIRRPRPALVPLTSDETWVRELSGITIPDVRLRVVDPQSDARPGSRRRRGSLPPGVLIERRGSLLFTHFGLSGPVVLDVSRAITGSTNPPSVVLVADFLPGSTAEELERHLRQIAASEGGRLVAAVIAEELPRRLVESLLARTEIPPDRRVAELTRNERARLADGLKRCEIRITGSRGFEKAEVTAGGVALDEIDSRTMQSKIVPNLFLAGEILDLDGFIGGYNFQAAFSTGWLAGECV